ncbi:MAG: hypothetical protein M1818_002353 [Claussenomyces sp. TS43310]|nr:MAG: hypothetical protein M1818_002353 [Claussenomyces sp. TS43310]
MVLTSVPALPVSSPVKRKANVYEDDDCENIDPVIFLSTKRTKGTDSYVKPSPTHSVLAKPQPSACTFSAPCSPLKATNSSRPILQARSPTPKIKTTIVEKPLTAPAGRSPTRKRTGILNRQRTTAASSPFTRIDPPKFSIGAANDTGAPFSIAAALSGTIPSYGARARAVAPPPIVREPEQIVHSDLELNTKKDAWFFEIHEDTEEETLHNLMYHSTCTLDISSDEESEAKRRDERGKENVPPVDDVSQSQARLPRDATRARSSRRSKVVDESAIEIDRSPLGDLEAQDFYADGCDAADVVLVADDAEVEAPEKETAPSFEFTVEAPVKGKGRAIDEAVELLMTRSETETPQQAALFSPIERAEDGFEVWESGSAKDENEILDA